MSHPKGKQRDHHIPLDDLLECRFENALSLNHRPVIRATDRKGCTKTLRAYRRKGVRANRLPRGSKRTTGVWNGQCVVDMIGRR